VLYCYWFGVAALPFSVVVRLNNGVTLLFWLSRNVVRVWSFSRSGEGRRLRVATLCVCISYIFVGFQSALTKVVEGIDLFRTHI
jgi:hypothetical protein